MVLTKSFRVWRKYKPRSVLVESKEIPDEALLFESNTVAILSPVELEIIRKECSYGDSLSAYGCLGVLSVDGEGGTSYQYLVVITECQALGKLVDADVFRVTQTAFIPLTLQSKVERVTEVGKLLASGKFYFSYPSYGATFDLLCCAQKQGKEQTQFHWNRSLYVYLERYGVRCSKWLYRVMCGHVDIQTLYAGDKKAKMVVISRISCERAGTRLNVRGVNDEGHVANFVETELALYCDQRVGSFVQIRGLVPLFWEQPGLQTAGGLIKIKLSRGYAASHPSFERHFEWCLLHHGLLLCLNLLGERNQETMLSNAFREHFAELSSAYCGEMVCYDYHKHIKVRGGSVESTLTASLLPLVTAFTTAHGFFVANDGQPTRLQTGTIRTNCLDCLDRTNSVQSFLSQQVLVELLSAMGIAPKPTLLTRFKQLLATAFTKNGDSLSLLYSGTKALSFEGKTNKLKGGARSVQRTILNNFMDGDKQEAIDMLLLGNVYSGDLGQKTRALLDQSDAFSPVPFRSGLCERWSDYTNSEKLRVAIATWNVNGGKLINSIALRGSQSLDDWLLDSPKLSGAARENPEEFETPPDLYAIGFEELVDLTAHNIVSTSSSNKREWAAALQKVLSRDTPYELLTAEQLVGVCLYIFIRPKHIPYVRDVAVSSVKTGMSGNAGNKGGVAIRLLLHATPLCFVCSHFAAHQNKVQERNYDFSEICRKIAFPHGQTVELHDYVFWCGDLNYRVDLPTTAAKDYISQARWDKLTKQDQLFKQKRAKKVFLGYIEGDLNFAPTYKYDQFSDDYDTSEKCRTPAWCDRVLWRRRARGGGDPRGLRSPITDQSAVSPPPGVDFGPHPSDAMLVCGGEMGDELVSVGHRWHPGRLLYYNRAELKQSDHRPVIALIEVDIYKVDATQRSKVREEVRLTLGPSDPTVVIEEQEEGTELSVTHLLETLRAFGEVVLVRVTDESVLVTFKQPKNALAATGLHGREVNGVRVNVNLREACLSGSEVTAPTQKERGKLLRRPTVSVLTSELLGVDSVGEDNERDDLMSFFDGMSDGVTTATGAVGGGLQTDEEDNDLESDTFEPELNLSTSDSDSETTVRSMKHTLSEPVIPVRPAPPKRPSIPPRPGVMTQQQSVDSTPLSSLPPMPKPRSNTVEFTVGGSENVATPEPQRPTRPPPPAVNSWTDPPPPYSSVVQTPPPHKPVPIPRASITKPEPTRPTIPKRPEAPRPVRPPPPKRT